MLSAKRILSVIWDYGLVTVGTILYCMGWTSFLIPNGIASGGGTGLCTIIYFATGIPVSYSFFVLNALLLILGSNGGQTSGSGDNHILGDLLVLTAQLSYAFYLVLFKNFVTRYSLVTIMKWMFTYAFICMLPFSYDDLIATDWLALDAAAVASLCYIVMFATFLSYLLIVVGQKSLRPTVAGMYNYVQPVVACIVAASLGLDSFNVAKGIAIVLIFTGVYLVTKSKSRADMPGTQADGKSR